MPKHADSRKPVPIHCETCVYAERRRYRRLECIFEEMTTLKRTADPEHCRRWYDLEPTKRRVDRWEGIDSKKK